MPTQSRMGEALELLILAQEDIETWLEEADKWCDTECSSHQLLKRIIKFLEKDQTIQYQEIVDKLARQGSNQIDQTLKSVM